MRVSPKKWVVPGNTASCEAGTPDEVAVDVAAAQLQEGYGVLELDGVAVAVGDQGRCDDAADLVVGPAGEALVERAELVEQGLQPVRVRGLGEVFLLHGGAGDHVDGHLRHRRGVLRAVSVGVERHRGDDQLAYQLGVADRQVQGHAAADAVAEDVSLRHVRSAPSASPTTTKSARSVTPDTCMIQLTMSGVLESHLPVHRAVQGVE